MSEKCNERIQSILSGMREIMNAVNDGTIQPVEMMVESQLHAIDDMVWGTVDIIKEGES